MRSRNLILVLLAGFVLAVGAIGAARRDADREQPRQPATAPSTTAPGPPGGVQADLVEANLPADEVVRARIGDEVELRVTSQAPDIAKIIQLGVQMPVGPGLPGTARFQALAVGSFDVMLEVAGRRVGRIVVSSEDERKPSDSG